MKEIENSINRAQYWRCYLNKSGLVHVNPIQWYLNMGLWETLGWTNEAASHHMFEWFVTGKNFLENE